MTVQTLIPFVPFLAVLYVAFALVQGLRHKRQGNVASILALVAVIAPLAAYLLSSDASVRASLLSSIAINSVLVFVTSLIVLMVERRAKTRDANRSFGILGIGVSFLLAMLLFVAPLIPSASVSTSTSTISTTSAMPMPFNTTDTSSLDTSTADTSANTTTGSNTANTVLIAAVTPGAVMNDSNFPAVDATPSAPLSAPDNSAGQTVTEDVSAPAAAVAQETTETTTSAAVDESLARPTPIVFPTATPTPDVTEVAAETTETTAADTVSAAATCTLTIDYNLNLRNLPTTEGSTVLVSIPYGTSVQSDGKTADGWYHVSYDGQSGWVSGAYLTAGSSCAGLPVTNS